METESASSKGMEDAGSPNRSAAESGASGETTVLHLFSGDLWAGAEVMVFHLLSELRKREGLKIVALSLNEGMLAEKLRNAEIETHVISEADHSFAAILSKARQVLKGRKVHVVHSHRYKENLLAFLLAKWIGAPRLVTTLHGLSEPVDLKIRVNYFVLKHFFTRVVAVSREIDQVLVQKYGFRREKIDVIYNGVPAPPVSLRGDSRNGSFHIGTVGRMAPVKDYNLFLEVAADVARRTDRVRFSILGDGPLKKELIRRAKELKIEERVAFLPPRPDPFSYYQSLDLYLSTSRHEGIPLSVLEAMASGKPVVAPRVGGLPEMISHGEQGLLMEDREPQNFSEACLRLLRDEALRRGMGENASRRVAASFSHSRMAASYFDLYQRNRARRFTAGSHDERRR